MGVRSQCLYPQARKLDGDVTYQESHGDQASCNVGETCQYQLRHPMLWEKRPCLLVKLGNPSLVLNIHIFIGRGPSSFSVMMLSSTSGALNRRIIPFSLRYRRVIILDHCCELPDPILSVEPKYIRTLSSSARNVRVRVRSYSNKLPGPRGSGGVGFGVGADQLNVLESLL